MPIRLGLGLTVVGSASSKNSRSANLEPVARDNIVGENRVASGGWVKLRSTGRNLSSISLQ